MEKSKTITIRLSEDALANIKNSADMLNMSLSDYIRKKTAEGIDRITYDPEAVHAFLMVHAEFRRIAEAVQIIARRCDPDNSVSIATLRMVQDELRDIKIKLSVLISKIEESGDSANGGSENAPD